jgi:FkbH-like protein
LDNTLWGGIVGEDGVNGIKIGEDTNIGSIYSEIQKILLNYKRMGILLCIASKNNPEDVEQAFKENKGMILKESDIILKKINWGSKSKNIEEIAKELNISLDSIVFLDDNPAERLEIKSLLPMVEVIDFPEDISLLPRILKSIPFFSTIAITEEDKKRHEMYQQDKKRGEFSKALSLEEYLKKLEIKISVKKNNISSLDRITQIINKTNQFNLRTQRYTKEKIKEMMESHDHIVASLNVKDKFGDLGLTGVIIIKKDNAYFIDTFLMSCRILSRNIEQQFFIEACRFLEDKQAEIIAEYIPTQKNKQVESLYESFGLNLLENSGIKKYKKVLGEINLKDVANIEVEKN